MVERADRRFNPTGWLIAASILGAISAIYLSRNEATWAGMNRSSAWMIGSLVGLLFRAMVYGGFSWLLVWFLFVRRRLPGSLDKGFWAVAAVFLALLAYRLLPMLHAH